MDYRKRGFVSIWVGHFNDPQSLASYVEQDFRSSPPPSRFGKDFQIGRYNEDGREASFKGEFSSTDEAFLERFSYSSSYRDLALSALKGMGSHTFNSVVLILDLKFEAAAIREVIKEDYQIRFLGAFEYRHS
jgi:hypothetical protein